jgi:hypothetical protein
MQFKILAISIATLTLSSPLQSTADEKNVLFPRKNTLLKIFQNT